MCRRLKCKILQDTAPYYTILHHIATHYTRTIGCRLEFNSKAHVTHMYTNTRKYAYTHRHIDQKIRCTYATTHVHIFTYVGRCIDENMYTEIFKFRHRFSLGNSRKCVPPTPGGILKSSSRRGRNRCRSTAHHVTTRRQRVHQSSFAGEMGLFVWGYRALLRQCAALCL